MKPVNEALQAPKRTTLPISNFIRILRFGSFMGFIPYTWDKKARIVRFRTHKVWKLTSLMWSGLMLAYGGYLVYGFYKTLTNEDTSTFVKFRVLYMNMAYLILDVGFLLNLRGYGQHQYVFNQLIKVASDFEEMFGTVGIKIKTLKWVMRVIAWGYVFGCTNAIAVFFSPQSPRLLTSLLTEPKKALKLVKLMFFVAHVLINMCNFYFLAFNALMLMLYVYVTVPLVGVFLWRPATNSVNFSSSRSSAKAFSVQVVQKHYTSLLVLQSAYTQMFGPWVLLIMVWCNIIATMNVFQSVIFENTRAFIMTLMVCFLMSRSTKTAARVFEVAEEVNKSWTSIQSPSWFPKFCKACRPVRIPLGNFFYFDRGIMLTFLNIIVYAASSLIVSYRKESSGIVVSQEH